MPGGAADAPPSPYRRPPRLTLRVSVIFSLTAAEGQDYGAD